jgi:hypothetical protein
MVAIVRPKVCEKLAYMRHSSEKATGRRTDIQTVIRRKGKILCFLNLPNEVLYCLNGIYVPPWISKVTQG